MNRYGYAPGYGNPARTQPAAGQQQQQIGPQPQQALQQQVASHASAQPYNQQAAQTHGYQGQYQSSAGWDASGQVAAQPQAAGGYTQPPGPSQYQQHQVSDAEMLIHLDGLI
jgi:hypothetical protein